MLNGTGRLKTRLHGLSPGERQRFHAYLRSRLQGSLLVLSFAMPLLLLVGWIRDYAVHPATAMQTLIVRLTLMAAIIAWACLLLVRRLRHWQDLIAVGYLCLFGSFIAISTINEPSRLSLVHVVTALMLIIWLRFALRPASIAGTVLALCIPLASVMAALHASPLLWVANGAFCLVGLWIGLAHRSAKIESWLELYLLRQRLLERLHQDALTGAANRDAWQSGATRAFRQALDTGQQVCVVFFDLDHFKAVNDLHGHATGDAILQQVSNIMSRNLRQGELLARIGGEEFVALLPGAGLEDALRVAERIRSEVEAIQEPIRVTVSAGVARARVGETLEDLTARADLAMLEAKRNGRNRIAPAAADFAMT